MLKMQGTILIVDDTPANLAVLSDCLEAANFDVLVAQDGESALQKIRYRAPDLILLDVMMPGIDGFETCRRLKATAQPDEIRGIPVIFMTALSDARDKVRGLKVGAVDYITKPFQQEEVLARIDIHLQLKRMATQLAQQNRQLQQEVREREAAQQSLQAVNQTLEQTVTERTQTLQVTISQLDAALKDLQVSQLQMIQAEKMAGLGQLVAGVAHEINNPVNFIYGNLKYAREYVEYLAALGRLHQDHCPPLPPELTATLEEQDLELDFVLEDLAKLFNSMQVGTERIREIVLALRHFSRADEAEHKAVDIHQGLDSTLMILQNRLKGRGDRPKIEVVKNYGSLPAVECYPGPLNQVFMNLLSNAIDALEQGYQTGQAGPKPQICIETQLTAAQQVQIAIADNGMGMPESLQQRIFEPFFTTKPVGKGTGIGLSISHQIITERHRGTFTCRSTPGVGTQFLIAFPMAQNAAEWESLLQPETC